jgi:hypothetical protein
VKAAILLELEGSKQDVENVLGGIRREHKANGEKGPWRYVTGVELYSDGGEQQAIRGRGLEPVQQDLFS